MCHLRYIRYFHLVYRPKYRPRDDILAYIGPKRYPSGKILHLSYHLDKTSVSLQINRYPDRYLKQWLLGLTNLHPELTLFGLIWLFVLSYTNKIEVLHQQNWYSNYLICRFCVPISINRTFSDLLTLPNNLQFSSASVQHIHISFLDELPSRFCSISWLRGFDALHLNPANNSYFFTHFVRFNFFLRQIWCPTTWEFSNQNGLTFWALLYWRLNNATNRTNLHIFGMTLLVSPIFTFEFLIYPFAPIWFSVLSCFLYSFEFDANKLHILRLICVLFILILISIDSNLFQAFHFTYLNLMPTTSLIPDFCILYALSDHKIWIYSNLDHLTQKSRFELVSVQYIHISFNFVPYHDLKFWYHYI